MSLKRCLGVAQDQLERSLTVRLGESASEVVDRFQCEVVLAVILAVDAAPWSLAARRTLIRHAALVLRRVIQGRDLADELQFG